MTAWLAITVTTVANMTIGSRNIFGNETIERIAIVSGFDKNKCALTEIIDQQCRKNEIEPCAWIGLWPKCPRSA